MKRSIFFTSIYLLTFLVVSVPLILNIKINELSNKINELNSEIYYLERSKNTIDLKHHESYSISSLEKLAKNHSYERLEISQKINKLEIPYKLNYERTEKIAILGFSDMKFSTYSFACFNFNSIRYFCALIVHNQHRYLGLYSIELVFYIHFDIYIEF